MFLMLLKAFKRAVALLYQWIQLSDDDIYRVWWRHLSGMMTTSIGYDDDIYRVWWRQKNIWLEYRVCV